MRKAGCATTCRPPSGRSTAGRPVRRERPRAIAGRPRNTHNIPDSTILGGLALREGSTPSPGTKTPRFAVFWLDTVSHLRNLRGCSPRAPLTTGPATRAPLASLRRACISLLRITGCQRLTARAMAQITSLPLSVESQRGQVICGGGRDRGPERSAPPLSRPSGRQPVGPDVPDGHPTRAIATALEQWLATLKRQLKRHTYSVTLKRTACSKRTARYV